MRRKKNYRKRDVERREKMKRGRTREKGEYIKEHVWWGEKKRTMRVGEERYEHKE